ncbi:MAG: RidA family protein [Candidatus Eisenbacteria bacterium]
MFTTVKSASAPAPVGPYSQAAVVLSGQVLFSAGQVPLDPATGQMCPGGIREQTGQVLENLRAVLEAGGFALNQVVKTTVFMINLGEFAAMNEVYQEWFREPYPARSCVEVRALPRGALVEMEVIAFKQS